LLAFYVRAIFDAVITFALVGFLLGSIAIGAQAPAPFKGTIFNLGTEPAPYHPAGPPKEIEESPPPAPGVGKAASRPMVAMALPCDHKMFTARAANSATVTSEMEACTIIITLAQRDSTGTSVGENAVLVLNARNR
jgi:hypothetical protein